MKNVNGKVYLGNKLQIMRFVEEPIGIQCKLFFFSLLLDTQQHPPCWHP